MPRALFLAAAAGSLLVLPAAWYSMGMVFGRVSEETPRFELLHRGLGYEVRRYAAYTAIETSTSGKGDDAAFGRLASFIGVFRQPQNEANEKIAMTAPVITMGNGQSERMQFVLPASKHGSAPRPMDPNVRLVERPGGVFAVETFSGQWDYSGAEQRAVALAQRVRQDGYVVDESVPWQFFRYNPPFTLPQLRTNEVAVPIKSDEQTE